MPVEREVNHGIRRGYHWPKDLVEMSADLMAQYPQLSPVRLPYENEEFTMESVSKGLAQNVHAFLLLVTCHITRPRARG